jgi:hypothetical protein
MLDNLIGFLAPVLAALSQKYGAVGVAIAYLIALIPLVSIAIELLEAAVLLTASTKDDEAAARIKAAWRGKVLPVLEMLPHINVPIAPAVARLLGLAVRGIKSLLAGIGAWKQGG